MLKGPQHRIFRRKHTDYGQGAGWEAETLTDGWESVSYRELVERVSAVLYVDASDESSSALYVNPQGESLLGYSREEWIEDPRLWVKTLHPEDRGRVLAAHDRARRTDGTFEAEYRMIARNGSVVWVRDEARSVAHGGKGPLRRAGVLIDVSDRKRYEEELRRSEERFRLVARATGEAIWDNDLSNDLSTDTQEWDGATEALFGYASHAGRTGAWWEERIHPDDRVRVLSDLRAVLGDQRRVWAEEYRFRRADGSFAEVEDRGYVVRDGAGTPVRMVGSMRDVTERKRREEELRESEERFRTTFEAAAVGMAHVTLDGRWLRVNRKACEIVGYDREELLSLSFRALTPPEDLEASDERIRRMLAGELCSYTVERRYVHKRGYLVWVSLSVSLVRRASGEPGYFVCVAKDITARKLRQLLPDPLTTLEAEVLGRIVAGSKNREIGEDLCYSMGTIKRCVQGVISKLGVRDRQQAAVRAVEIGIVSPSHTGAL